MGFLGLLILVLDIIAIVDCLKSPNTTVKKALWILLIIIFPLVGLVIYYFLGRKKGTTQA